MSFYSFPFIIFFSVLFALYYFLPGKSAKVQNSLLLVASYFFYGYADLKMLWLLATITLVYFGLGIGMERAKSDKAASLICVVGVVVGIATLVYFKYLNFFIESFTSFKSFKIILPIGISFFIFRLLSYIIEIRRGHIEATHDILKFAAYVSFFPCIMAGPIDRPGFMSQLESRRNFDYDITVDGLRQFIWGLFKKVAVADNIAGCVDSVWSVDFTTLPAGTLFTTAILYSFQMYMDFSGYSDMAIGVGKTLGLKVSKNFNYPFFAVNVADYWRRWHMSLTSWLTDYVFMPLNVRFRNLGKFGIILAIIINFVLVGMWHGDNWTFAIFGLYHGLLFVPLILSGAFFKKSKIKTGRLGLPILKDAGRMMLTFLLVTIGLIIFRADSLPRAFSYIGHLFSARIIQFELERRCFQCFAFILLVMLIEWVQRKKDYGLEISAIKSTVLRYAIYIAVLVTTLIFSTDSSAFIYAQF